MTLRLVLTVFEIALLVGTLAFFLNVVARQLNSISATCAKITFGVRAVETQCAVIGPATDQLNGALQSVAGKLQEAGSRAERLGR